MLEYHLGNNVDVFVAHIPGGVQTWDEGKRCITMDTWALDGKLTTSITARREEITWRNASQQWIYRLRMVLIFLSIWFDSEILSKPHVNSHAIQQILETEPKSTFPSFCHPFPTHTLSLTCINHHLPLRLKMPRVHIYLSKVYSNSLNTPKSLTILVPSSTQHTWLRRSRMLLHVIWMIKSPKFKNICTADPTRARGGWVHDVDFPHQTSSKPCVCESSA